MGRLIEELDYRDTAMGPLILRRRWVAAIDADVVEGSNLQRQIIHTDGRIGAESVRAASASGQWQTGFFQYFPVFCEEVARAARART